MTIIRHRTYNMQEADALVNYVKRKGFLFRCHCTVDRTDEFCYLDIDTTNKTYTWERAGESLCYRGVTKTNSRLKDTWYELQQVVNGLSYHTP